jgi:hypothetical protein
MNYLVKAILKKGKISISGISIFTLILFTSCGTPKETVTDPANYEELKELVNTREFSIEFQWAQPLGGGMIDLMSNPNHIRFKGDEVDIFLPYFGVRHSGGGYGSNTGGIKYEGEISDLNITEDRSKRNIHMKFEGRQDSEILLFNVTLYENGKAHASVSSSERANIVYQGGDVKATPQETER